MCFLLSCRNGRFFLRSSKNIISSKTLQECEEALNQGSMTAAKAFINLRRNSILHLFACIGRFLGLEVWVIFSTLKMEFVLLSQMKLLRLLTVFDFHHILVRIGTMDTHSYPNALIHTYYRRLLF